MTRLPAPDSDGLHTRYPAVFERPLSAQLATPLMLIGAFAVFVFGLVHLGFSPARMLSGLHQLGWITMMMIPPDPGSSLPLYMKAQNRDDWRDYLPYFEEFSYRYLVETA